MWKKQLTLKERYNIWASLKRGITQKEIVEKKNRIGDFEIDTAIGLNHVGALVTIVDRKSKYTIIGV